MEDRILLSPGQRGGGRGGSGGRRRRDLLQEVHVAPFQPLLLVEVALIVGVVQELRGVALLEISQLIPSFKKGFFAIHATLVSRCEADASIPETDSKRSMPQSTERKSEREREQGPFAELFLAALGGFPLDVAEELQAQEGATHCPHLSN
jgi:hypothetical protein